MRRALSLLCGGLLAVLLLCVGGSQRSQAGAHYYLYPPNLHLSAGATSSVPLTVIDDDGQPVTGTLTFFNNSDLIAISPDGYVTALRAETNDEIGVWVTAARNGTQLASASIVRVLGASYAIPFSQTIGAHTILYYPAIVSGEDLAAQVAYYDIALINEYAYTIQTGLMGVAPFAGAKQVFEVDFGESEQQRVCGISGNPVRLGWNLSGGPWQNCFLAPFPYTSTLPMPRSPQWTVFYHELGHNFTWASVTFAAGLSDMVYSEGVATAISLATIKTVLDDPATYPAAADTAASLQYLWDDATGNFGSAFQTWLAAGADFGQFNPDIADGLWLYYEGLGPADFSARFFQPLQPAYYPQLAAILSDLGADGQHTFYAALISAAMGQDLSGTFSSQYHFPIDADLFEAAYSAIMQILSSAGPEPDAYGFLIDGLDSDWLGRAPAAVDAAGDSICGAGTDLTAFHAFATPDDLYIMQQVAGDEAAEGWFHFHIDVTLPSGGGHYLLDLASGHATLYDEDTWQAVGSPAGAVQTVAEARIPWTMLGAPEQVEIWPVAPGAQACDAFASSIAVSHPATATMALSSGWNLVSLPLAPQNSLVTETLRSITGSYDLVYAYRAEDAGDPWKKYSMTAPGFLNDLKVITEVMGIWLHATSNVTLTITGTLPVTTAMPLTVGWNLEGYPSFVTQPVTVALASCAGSYNLVYAYHAEDTLDQWKKYSTSAPDFLNDLKVMAPGRGYWINATAACVWRP